MSAILMAMALWGGQGIADGNRPDACVFDRRRGAIVLNHVLGDRSAAPGETVEIDPQWTPFPHSYYGVPHRCLTGWRVSDRTLATLSTDRRRLTIARNAPEGATVTLSARYRDETVSQNVRVIVPVASPLVGSWRQPDADCPGAAGLFQLAFNRDGTFSVTFGLPMHSNVDYRGRWRVDGDRLVLSDVAASSGAVPGDSSRDARFTIGGDGRLSFDVPWHGTSATRGTCRAPFRR